MSKWVPGLCCQCHQNQRPPRQWYCLACRREQYRENADSIRAKASARYWRDPEGMRARKTANRAANRDSYAAARHRAYINNRTVVKRKAREYYWRNREKILAQKKIWAASVCRADPDALNEKARLRRRALCECGRGPKDRDLGACVECAWADGTNDGEAIVIAILRGMGGVATMDAIQAEVDPASDRKVVSERGGAPAQTSGYRRALRCLKRLAGMGRVLVREEPSPLVSGKSDGMRNVYVLVDKRRAK